MEAKIIVEDNLRFIPTIAPLKADKNLKKSTILINSFEISIWVIPSPFK